MAIINDMLGPQVINYANRPIWVECLEDPKKGHRGQVPIIYLDLLPLRYILSVMYS